MTGKIGRTKELQDWRVTSRAWLVRARVLLQEERDRSAVCRMGSVPIGSFRGAVWKRFHTLFVRFPCSWRCGDWIYSVKHAVGTAGKRYSIGEPSLEAGNGDTPRDDALSVPEGKQRRLPVHFVSLQLVSDSQINLQQKPDALGRGPTPPRVGPWDARREIFRVRVPGGKDKCACLVGPTAGRGQRRGALKSEKWVLGSVPGTDANEGETIQTATQSDHSSALH